METQKRETNLNVRLTDSEAEILRRAAELRGASLSVWCRSILLVRAQKDLARLALVAERQARESLAKHGDPRKEGK